MSSHIMIPSIISVLDLFLSDPGWLLPCLFLSSSGVAECVSGTQFILLVCTQEVKRKSRNIHVSLMPYMSDVLILVNISNISKYWCIFIRPQAGIIEKRKPVFKVAVMFAQDIMATCLYIKILSFLLYIGYI